MPLRLTALVIIIILSSCASDKSGKESTTEQPGQQQKYEQQLLDANKKAVKTESRQIRDFIRRNDWKMKETGTGLLYYIYEKGKGRKAEKDLQATIEYQVNLIRGDTIYSSDKSGPLTFTVGKGDVPTGLHEGILLMRVGDRAKFVIPSHLAYGLLGDQNKVPPKATLIYDVRLVALK